MEDSPLRVNIIQDFGNFQGVWIQDGERCDSMEEAISLMELNGLIRTAIRTIKGVELRLTATEMGYSVFSFLPGFKVQEWYKLSGDPSVCGRRDMRRGKHTGQVELDNGSGIITLRLKWDEPHAGSAVDEFRLAGLDELHVTSTLLLKAQTVVYTKVYRRQGS